MSSIKLTTEMLQRLDAETRAKIDAVVAEMRPSKKPAAADGAEPKEKRPANSWILFSVRVERLIREIEAAAGGAPEAKMKTVRVKQFCSHLKSQKAYESWTDEEIRAALPGWTPPEVSKQEAAGKSKRKQKAAAAAAAGGAAAAAEPASDAESATSGKSGKRADAAKARWAAMTAEQRAERVAKMQAGRGKKPAAAAAEALVALAGPAPAAAPAPAGDVLAELEELLAEDGPADAPAAAPEKPKRKWSEEAKASAAAKRAAKKAAKAAGGAASASGSDTE